MRTEDIKKRLTKRRRKQRVRSSDFLSTGSTLLDLAISGKIRRGFSKGKYFYIVGDTMSGKTFLSLTCFAEAASSSHFENYRLIFDNSEDGALMSIERFFGKKLATRMEPPSKAKDGTPNYSESVEEFYYHIDDAINEGTPFLYLLDSMDSLSSKDEAEKFRKQKRAHRQGKKISGTYGDGKAKKNSAAIRQLLPRLRETGSILIVISQTRDNLGISFDPRTRSGGRALTFYATVEIWSSCGKKIKKIVRDKARVIGVNSILEVKKNRVTGQNRKVSVPILYKLGIDDIGSCVAFLIEENHWHKRANKIKATEFDFEGSRSGLIRKIEEEGLENDLRMVVQEVWDEIEDACDPKRKRRYE